RVVMDQFVEESVARTRRHFFRDCGVGVGTMALASLLAEDAGAVDTAKRTDPLAPKPPHFKPKAKSVIFLFMAGGPSQLDLFTPKEKLTELSGKPVPKSFIEGKRFAFLKGTPNLLGSPRKFAKYGENGMDLSELMPHHQKIVDEVCWVRGMKTDVFNH